MRSVRRRLEIVNRQRRARPRRRDIEALIDHLLEVEQEPRGLAIVFVGERVMRRLHREWIGEDRATDVLSFPLGAPPPGLTDEEAPIGEIVVCVPVCEAQARSRGASLHEEIARMLIHGCLHLLGHDHGAIPDRRRMRSRERRHLDWYRRGRLRVLEVG